MRIIEISIIVLICLAAFWVIFRTIRKMYRGEGCSSCSSCSRNCKNRR